MCLAHGNSSEANQQRLGLGLTPGFLPLSHSLFFVSKWQIPVRYGAIRRYPDLQGLPFSVIELMAVNISRDS